jgi:hypothetical protein
LAGVAGSSLNGAGSSDGDTTPTGLFESPDDLISQGIVETSMAARKQLAEKITSSPDASKPVDEPDETGEQSDALLPPEDDEEEESDETPDEISATSGDGSPTEQPEGEGEQAVVRRWAEVLVAKPQRLSEVPAKHRVAVFEATVQLAAEITQHVTAEAMASKAKEELQKIHRIAYQQGYEKARQDISTDQEMAELDSMAEDDPAEFSRLVRSKEPDDVARIERYRQWQKEGTASAQQLGPYQVLARDLIQAEGVTEAEGRRLQQADDEHLRTYGVRRYQPSFEGLRVLEADIKMLRNGNGAQPKKPDASLSAAAKNRQEAAKKLKSVPKPDVGGRVADSPLPDDVSELVSMGWADSLSKHAAGVAR